MCKRLKAQHKKLMGEIAQGEVARISDFENGTDAFSPDSPTTGQRRYAEGPDPPPCYPRQENIPGQKCMNSRRRQECRRAGKNACATTPAFLPASRIFIAADEPFHSDTLSVRRVETEETKHV
jgi:hypothetical protein